jgi:NTE family protein
VERSQVGLALGAGAARGWTHIGILQGLMEIGIKPDIICGTSAGALVGGAYVAGQLEDLEQWLRSLSRLDVIRFYDVSWSSSGLLAGKRIINFFRQRFGDVEIESLPQPYAAVATNLRTGRETCFRSGSLLDAVRASISVPGLLEPFYLDGEWYVDGGIVNPIPVSTCRILGADVVIAVDVNRDWKSKIEKQQAPLENDPKQNALDENHDPEIFPLRLTKGFKDRVGEAISGLWRGNTEKPGLYAVLNNTTHFMQESITRSRLAVDPPDTILCPKTNGIGLMDFHRAAEAIEIGKRCIYRREPELLDLSRQALV